MRERNSVSCMREAEIGLTKIDMPDNYSILYSLRT
jgi:hypothetical protein